MALRLFNSSSTLLPRFLPSRSLLLLRSYSARNSLLPMLMATSMVHTSGINCCQRSCSFSTSSAQEKKSPCVVGAVADSVVTIFSFNSEPNVFLPWQKSEEKEFTGSGFVISGRRILTTAQIVDNHSYVQVRKHSSPTRYKARVEVSGYECNLAIIVVDSEEFWEDMNPLELGDLPFPGEVVSIFGYPRASEAISVTNCTVSKVEVGEYHGGDDIELLTIQIDAVIDRGKSGGPAVMGNKVVGVAFQGLYFTKDIGYIIPILIIKHFLSGVEENGQYMGFSCLDIWYQTMENSQLRRHFKMTSKMTGVLINQINPLSHAHKFMKKNDVILAIDGTPIGNDETVLFRKTEQINFNHLVSMKNPGETTLFKVLRDGREYEFNINLKPVLQLVPKGQFLKSYYIFAGFVFVPLSIPYLEENKNMGICCCAWDMMCKKAGEQIVIISQVLSDDINIGYLSFKDLKVKKVNGVEVLNLKHLYEYIEKCCTKFLRLDLEDDRVVVLNYKCAKEATPLILERHGIPSVISKDL